MSPLPADGNQDNSECWRITFRKDTISSSCQNIRVWMYRARFHSTSFFSKSQPLCPVTTVTNDALGPRDYPDCNESVCANAWLIMFLGLKQPFRYYLSLVPLPDLHFPSGRENVVFFSFIYPFSFALHIGV